MPESAPHKIITALLTCVLKTYNEEEFGILLYNTLEGFNYSLNREGDGYPGRAFNVLLKLERTSGKNPLLALVGAILRERAGHEGIKILQDLMGETPMVENVPGPGGAPAPAGEMPEKLATLVALLRQERPPLEPLAWALRAALAGDSSPALPWLDGFRLSDREGVRLAAILVLECTPRPDCLHWLSERVWVESSFVGFMASQALWVAALRFPPDAVPRVREAVVWAADQLDVGRGPPRPLDGRFEASYLKAELTDIITLLDQRSQEPPKGCLPPTELDRFLSAVAVAFDLRGLEGLFLERLKTPLRLHVRLDHPDDPVAILIAKVDIKARQVGWEPALIAAAYAERPADAVFQNLFQRYCKQA
jgi:hypothetical protein